MKEEDRAVEWPIVPLFYSKIPSELVVTIQ